MNHIIYCWITLYPVESHYILLNLIIYSWITLYPVDSHCILLNHIIYCWITLHPVESHYILFNHIISCWRVLNHNKPITIRVKLCHRKCKILFEPAKYHAVSNYKKHYSKRKKVRKVKLIQYIKILKNCYHRGRSTWKEASWNTEHHPFFLLFFDISKIVIFMASVFRYSQIYFQKTGFYWFA